MKESYEGRPEWSHLLRNCCPKCGGDLGKKERGSECEFKLCGFFIRAEKFEELKVNLRRQQFISKMSNARKHRLLEA